MSLERVDSVDPTEVYDYIICGYVSFCHQRSSHKFTDVTVEVERLDVSLPDG
jgi:hypothetical protein